MKVLFDAQIFSWQRFGGISRYFVELMSRLPNDIQFSNSVLLTNNVYLRSAKSSLNRGFSIPDFRGRAKIVEPINKVYDKVNLKLDNFDIFHPTYYDPYFLKHLRRPYVITVHDMIHELFSQGASADIRMIEQKRIAIENAKKIIAISKNTKFDLMRLYGIPEERIEIVNLGHSVNVQVAEEIPLLPKHYILFVGQRVGYKNFERFLKAFSLIHNVEKDVKLVCTGAPFTQNEIDLLKALKIEADVVHLFVSDAQMTYLYQHALCFVFPSLYEGFGIPILEAFAAKCPLVLSDASCFPEIAQDGGAYFNPNNEESMSSVILKVISDREFSQKLISRGTQILSQYSWDRMANEIADVYRKIYSC